MNRLLIVLVLLALPRLARADEVCAQQAQAQLLFDEGAELFRKKAFPAACEKLEASVNLCPRFVGARGRLAECYEQTGRLASAWAAWRDVAGVADKTGNDKDRQRAEVARGRAAGLEKRVGRLLIEVPADVRMAGLVVSRDGLPLDAAAFGSAVPVDAGRHRLRASAPGHVPWRMDVEVADGAQVVAALEPLEPLPAVAPERITETRVVRDLAAERRRRRDRLVTAAAVGGAGLVALGGATYFGLGARAAWNDARDDHGCTDAGACPDAAGVARVEDARRSARTADVLVGVAGVAVVAGAILWLTAPAVDEGRVRTAIAPLPGGLGVVAAGRF